LPQSGGGAQGQPSAPPRPGGMSPLVPAQADKPADPAARKKLRRVIVALCALVVVVIAGVVALAVLNGQRSPEARTRQYLQLLADGKAEAATAMVDPGIANEERVFMTDAVMQAASARIEITEVKESQESSKNKGDVRYVTATLSLDGQRFTHDFALTQGKKEFGVLDNWQITEAFMLKVEVKAKGIPAVSIGDATKTLAKDDNSITVYPGVYTVSAANTGEYVTAPPVTVSAADDFSSRTITFEATYSDALKAAALDAAVAKTKSCGSVENAGNLDEDCPNSVRSKTLTVLNVKEVPTQIVGDKYRQGSFAAEYAVITKQEGSGLFKESAPRDQKYTVRLEVRVDENNTIRMGADGKPQFTFSWSEY
ncbi:hypothetical protein, partial [Pauljensenia hongkongensis]